MFTKGTFLYLTLATAELIGTVADDSFYEIKGGKDATYMYVKVGSSCLHFQTTHVQE